MTSTPRSASLPLAAGARDRRLLIPALLAGAFLLLNAFLLISRGVQMSPDSAWYLRGAGELQRGDSLAISQLMYAGYVAVVAACQFVGIGLVGVVIVQIAVAGCAALAQYDMGNRLGGRSVGLLAAGLLALNPDVARWHTFILTDSLYTSSVTLSVWFVHRAAELRGRWYIPAILALLFAASLRPNGKMLIPLAVAYWLARALPKARWRPLAVVVATAVLALTPLLAIYVRPGLEIADENQELRKGSVIWGDEASRVPMPVAPPSRRRGWPGAIEYALHEPVATLRLMATRVGMELIHTRAWYGASGNALILLGYLPLYALAIVGFLRVRREALARLLAIVTASQIVLIAGTFADWDGRFLIYMLPAISVFAACGLAGLWPWRQRSARAEG